MSDPGAGPYWADCAVVVDGVQIRALDLGVQRTKHRKSDTWWATLALSVAAAAGFDLDYWGGATPNVVLFGAVGRNGPVDPLANQLISGLADDIEVNPVTDRVRLSGRDKAAALLEQRTSDKLQNMTVAEVASLYASKAGLSANVTGGDTLIGQNYELETAGLPDQSTLWDVLVRAAKYEGADLYVEGDTLYFGGGGGGGGGGYTVTYTPAQEGKPPGLSAGCLRLDLKRRPALGNATVTVQSWSSKSKASVTATSSKTSGVGQPQQHLIRKPGLTQDQAQQVADGHLSDVTRNEMEVSVEAIADPSLTPQDTLTIAGTGSAWDQTYEIDELTIKFDSRGAEMSITGKIGGDT